MARRPPTHTAKLAGTMRGMSMNPRKNATDPKSIKVEEIPKSKDANPRTENLGVLRGVPDTKSDALRRR